MAKKSQTREREEENLKKDLMDRKPKRFKKALLSYTLAGAMVLSVSPFALPVADSGTGSIAYANGNSGAAHDQKIVNRVDAERAIEHIRYLSEEIGSRPGGLEGEKEAADYVANNLKKLGFDVEYQYFPVADQY